MDPEQQGGEMEQERLREALNTIADVVLRAELQGVLDRVSGLEKELTERIEVLNRQTINAVDRVRQETDSQIFDLRNSLAAEENARQGLAGELDRQVEQARSGVEEKVQDVHRSLEESLVTRETSLRSELNELREQQSELQRGFQEQTEKAQRLSAVLDNLAGVFSRQMGGQLPETVETSPPAVSARTVSESWPNRPPFERRRSVDKGPTTQPDGEMIDELVDQAFDAAPHSGSDEPHRH